MPRWTSKRSAGQGSDSERARVQVRRGSSFSSPRWPSGAARAWPRGGDRCRDSPSRTRQAEGQLAVSLVAATRVESVVVGTQTLRDPGWKNTLLKAIADPKTKFSVSIDGLAGSSTVEKVLRAVQLGS